MKFKLLATFYALAIGTAPAIPVQAKQPIAAQQLVTAKVDGIIRTAMAERRIPGMQVAVVRHGRIVFSRAYGLANVEHRVAVKPTSLFSINSATKSFTGVAAMQLVEDGKLDLEAPIARYLDGLPAAWQTIKVRQLLDHTSGLPNIVDGNGLIGTGGEAEAWAEVARRPVESPPGTRFAYNQTNYALLARIINRQAGMPFTDYFAQRQFAPAGMGKTRFGDTFDVIDNTVGAYSYFRNLRGQGEVETKTMGRWIDDLPAFMRTGAGIYTTADELGGWLIALQSGKLLKSKSSLTRLWTADRLNDGSINTWAMGWPVLQTTPRKAVGGLGGGRSAFFVYPDDDLAVVVLTNLVGGNPQTFIGKIADAYLSDPVPGNSPR